MSVGLVGGCRGEMLGGGVMVLWWRTVLRLRLYDGIVIVLTDSFSSSRWGLLFVTRQCGLDRKNPRPDIQRV